MRPRVVSFYNDYRDLQVSYTDPAYPGNSIRGNASKAHTLGVELETDARLPFGLGLQFGGGYLRAIYDTYKNAGGPGVNADGHSLIKPNDRYVVVLSSRTCWIVKSASARTTRLRQGCVS